MLGLGTPVHAWSSAPTKDLVRYVLGVTPAEPGYTSVRVAPGPGRIDRVSGSVPTPHGLVGVEVDAGTVFIESPVPVRFVALDGSRTTAPAGSSTFQLSP